MDFVKTVDYILEKFTFQKIIIGFMILLSNLKTSYFKKEINEKQNKTSDILNKISEHKYYRKLLILISFYMYSKDIIFSIIFTLLFILINKNI